MPAQVRNLDAEQVRIAEELDTTRAGFAKVAEEAGGKVVWAVKRDLVLAQRKLGVLDGGCILGVEPGVCVHCGGGWERVE
jgi:hypothetical protein